eukprot:scaffold4979_cov73-Cylindrotheca_fusiformis.AAC.8
MSDSDSDNDFQLNVPDKKQLYKSLRKEPISKKPAAGLKTTGLEDVSAVPPAVHSSTNDDDEHHVSFAETFSQHVPDKHEFPMDKMPALEDASQVHPPHGADNLARTRYVQFRTCLYWIRIPTLSSGGLCVFGEVSYSKLCFLISRDRSLVLPPPPEETSVEFHQQFQNQPPVDRQQPEQEHAFAGNHQQFQNQPAVDLQQPEQEQASVGNHQQIQNQPAVDLQQQEQEQAFPIDWQQLRDEGGIDGGHEVEDISTFANMSIETFPVDWQQLGDEGGAVVPPAMIYLANEGEFQDDADGLTIVPTENDVLMERGRASFNHAGSRWFSWYCSTLVADYRSSSSTHRRLMIKVVLDRFREDGVRFLKRVDRNSPWEVVTDERAIKDKIRRA